MSISLDINLGGLPRNGTGAVIVTPDRLLTFSAAPIVQGGGSAAGQILPSAGAAALLANGGRLPTAAPRYTFRINPDELQVTAGKLEQYRVTQAGYSRQYWGNQTKIFQYSGSSGVFRPDIPNFLLPNPASFDIRTTPAWQKFREFERFFESVGSTNVFMFSVDYPYDQEGSLNDFQFKRSGKDRPFEITYSFKFTALPLAYAPATATSASSALNAQSNQAAAASAIPFLGSGLASGQGR